MILALNTLWVLPLAICVPDESCRYSHLCNQSVHQRRIQFDPRVESFVIPSRQVLLTERLHSQRVNEASVAELGRRVTAAQNEQLLREEGESVRIGAQYCGIG